MHLSRGADGRRLSPIIVCTHTCQPFLMEKNPSLEAHITRFSIVIIAKGYHPDCSRKPPISDETLPQEGGLSAMCEIYRIYQKIPKYLLSLYIHVHTQIFFIAYLYSIYNCVCVKRILYIII